MANHLNPPENIVANLNGATERMRKVDALLGPNLIKGFAEGVSAILGHCDIHEGCLCSRLSNKTLGAEVAIQIVNATAELETAWNCVRLANVPACLRQTRVGLECIAFAIVMSIPVSEVIMRLPRKLAVVKILVENPGMSIAQLYRPIYRSQGKIDQRTGPKLKGNVILPALFAVADKLLEVPANLSNLMRQHVDDALHPASHSSIENSWYHFEDFGPASKAGARFSEQRADTFRTAAGNLANLTNHLASFLDLTYQYLGKHQAQGGLEV